MRYIFTYGIHWHFVSQYPYVEYNAITGYSMRVSHADTLI